MLLLHDKANASKIIYRDHLLQNNVLVVSARGNSF